MFRLYDEGATLQGLCTRLEALGVRPPSHGRTGNGHWGRASVRAILTNVNYIGAGYVATTERRPGEKKKRIKPREEWVRLPDGTYPKVVDDALFARVPAAPAQQDRERPG